MADIDYNSGRLLLGQAGLNFTSDTLKCALLTNAHEPSAGHEKLADVVAHEVSGTGYTAGGATLSGVSWSLVEGVAVLDATDPQWTEATFTARYAAIYAAKTVGEVVNPLVCLLDFGADKSVTAGTFTVQFNTSGILTLS